MKRLYRNFSERGAIPLVLLIIIIVFLITGYVVYQRGHGDISSVTETITDALMHYKIDFTQSQQSPTKSPVANNSVSPKDLTGTEWGFFFTADKNQGQPRWDIFYFAEGKPNIKVKMLMLCRKQPTDIDTALNTTPAPGTFFPCPNNTTTFGSSTTVNMTIEGDYDGSTFHLIMHSSCGQGKEACNFGDTTITGNLNNSLDQIDGIWAATVNSNLPRNSSDTPNRIIKDNFSAKKFGKI